MSGRDGPKILDLGDSILSGVDEDFYRGRWNREPLMMAWVAWRLAVRKALDDHASIIHIFHDPADDAVRLHGYQPVFDGWSDDGRWTTTDWCKCWGAEGILDFLKGWLNRPVEEPFDPLMAPRAWIQSYPFPGSFAAQTFEELRGYAGMGRDDYRGRLCIRCGDGELIGDVEAPQYDDLRICFTSERPRLLRKTPEQFAEIGEPMPDWSKVDIFGRPLCRC